MLENAAPPQNVFNEKQSQVHVYSTIILHANLQYAEIPKDEIPRVIKNSYIPVLKELLEQPKVEVAFNFTGVTLEILNNEYPETIELIKEGIKKEKFELTGSGYSHPIFPLLPEEDKKRQIEFNERSLKSILNYKPEGFWLPELAYDPTLPSILRQYGYNYIFFDDELYQSSSPLKNMANKYNEPLITVEKDIVRFLKAKGLIKKVLAFRKALKNITKQCKSIDFMPIEIKGARGTITGIKAPRSWFLLTYSSLLGYPFLNEKKVLKMLSQYKKHQGLITLYAMDLEFFGYRSYIEGRYVDHTHLSNMLNKITKTGEIELILPKRYLKKYKPKKIGYMRTGSWAPDKSLDIWTKDEDNKKLERMCEEIRTYLHLASENENTDEIWRHLLLAENSDGRGWDPIPERRLECFSHALEALNLAKELLKRE